MDAAIGIGRAIVQHIPRPSLPFRLNLVIELLLFPPGQHVRLPLRQIGLHREIGFWKVERGFVIHRQWDPSIYTVIIRNRGNIQE